MGVQLAATSDAGDEATRRQRRAGLIALAGQSGRMNLQETFGTDAPVVGMVHLPPLPGAPRFDGVPSRLGQAFMSIPATTAFEFGLGREAREVAGIDRNEDWKLGEDGDPVPVGNDHGGLQGGITTGEPIYGEITWHAPTSIPKEQTTVDWETGEEKEVQVVGRHDPVLPPRAVPVVEAMLACTLLDFMLLGGRINPDRLDGQPGEYDTDYHPSQPE